MKRLFLLLIPALVPAQQQPSFRPPAVPLVVHDPYFSIWSMSDRLNADATRHWTGHPRELVSLIRVDGTAYRLMGAEPREAPALQQTSVEVLPTRTIYRFTAPKVAVEMTWTTPALLDDPDLLSRPITYLTWRVSSSDGRQHDIALYLDASYDLAVNTDDEPVTFGRVQIGDLPVLRVGSQEQPVLKKQGDDVRIDWGHFYLAPDRAAGVHLAIRDADETRAAFVKNGHIPDFDNPDESTPVLAMEIDPQPVGAAPVSRYAMLAYDDVWSIEYFQRRVRPWWRRNGAGVADILRAASRDYAALTDRCARFDEELTADLRSAGGEKYAHLASLAYRQALGAQKLVADADGTALYFPKEDFSNGCIGTVDVIYPGAPMLLLFAPKLLEAELRPVFDYAAMPRWKFPFAPHDLGTYPKADGQVYGGGERTEEDQMPVEESGNLLILTAALARAEGNAAFAAKYWPLLEKWAAYLKEKGLDPENQLSTDDFAGHLAHNANLSIKAIDALGAFAQLCDLTGHRAEATRYRTLAEQYARRWTELAADGDHYKLAFDKPGTWSQKYNLVWDRLLGLNLFPPDVARRELAFYATHQKTYGLPLDNRKDYTKLDWIFWTATLADSKAEFESLIDPAWRFANESPTRVPLTDFYSTTTAKKMGFQARSVVGGLFIRLLADPEVARKWQSRATAPRSQ
ncbi:MAG TPA: DUF4965 domain-containing protein [Bryobacteraceae bacterium]|nr:DUF4965 domain-containing protein [Bryobacteraceae bacterium]